MIAAQGGLVERRAEKGAKARGLEKMLTAMVEGPEVSKLFSKGHGHNRRETKSCPEERESREQRNTHPPKRKRNRRLKQEKSARR